MTFHAFADDNSSYNVADLTCENNGHYLSVYGDAQFGKDQQGLQQLLELKRIVDEAVECLQNTVDLPEQIDDQDNPEQLLDNPFL